MTHLEEAKRQYYHYAARYEELEYDIRTGLVPDEDLVGANALLTTFSEMRLTKLEEWGLALGVSLTEDVDIPLAS